MTITPNLKGEIENGYTFGAFGDENGESKISSLVKE
jgi:hypothetical protein